MTDKRIDEYRKLVEALQGGIFKTEVDTDPHDNIGRLGDSLIALAKILEMRYEEQNRLATITEKINQGLFIDEVMGHVYDAFHGAIPYTRIGLAFLEDGGRRLRAHWARSDADDFELRKGFSQKMEGSSLLDIVNTGEPRIINDLVDHLAKHPDSHSTRLIVDEGIRSSLTCPLLVLGKPVGFIFFSSRDRDVYKKIHQRVFLQIAGCLSTIVEKSRLYEELHRLKCEIEEMRDAFEHQATHDALTGLWNRRAIEQLLTKAIASARRSDHSVAVIMIDIDHFKTVNDTYGHQTGDDILREISRRLELVSRGEDSVGRFGGEEFQIVLSVSDMLFLEDVAERYRVQIEAEPVMVQGKAIPVTISLGVGMGRAREALDACQLVSLADDALYEAKASGRNRIVIKVEGTDSAHVVT